MRTSRAGGSVTEALESRLLLSHAMAVADPVATPPIDGVRPIVIGSGGTATPAVSNASAPYTPALVRSAYGIGSISFNGTSGTGAGETIAIIDAFNDPGILSDANYFSSYFSLPTFNTAGNPTLTVVGQTGTSTLPANSTSDNGGWDLEESLDVEWAHAVAPQANLVLVEASSASMSDLSAAVTTAANMSGVSVVSMSFGSTEFSGETSYDSNFLTPAGHAGVTFLASTGDKDAPGEYPAYSPNVVAVGGTSLTISSGGAYESETAWGNTSTQTGGGGGVSAYETQPSYQNGHVNNLGGTSSPKRTTPDVSFLADPNTGVYVYDNYNQGAYNGGFYSVGGTSLACPMWAGLIAIANQQRAASGLGTLNGKTQVLPTLYSISSSNYHDITTGNNGFAAGAGYDLATGLGTPIANQVVPLLATLGAAVPGVGTHLAFSAQPPSSSTAGNTFNLSVEVLDGNGNLASSDSGTVTLTLTGNAAALNGTTTATVSNGVAGFTGLWMTQAGSGYTITAAETSMTGATSSAIQITPAAASQLVFVSQPAGAALNAPMPTVSVAVEDTYGNVVSTDGSTITLTLSGSTFVGGGSSMSVNCNAGVAAFTALAVQAVGSYTLTAADGSFSSITSNSFTIAKGTPTIAAGTPAATYDGTAHGLSSAVAADAYTGATLGTWGDGTVTVTYYAGTLSVAQASDATALSGAPTSAGSYTAVVRYAGTSSYNAVALADPFTITRRLLHVTAVAQNKAYNRSTAATVTLSDDRLSGDVLTVSYTGATFASSAAGTGRTVTVAGLSLSGTAAIDYQLASGYVTTTANITPLNVTGSITAATKVYDGTTAAMINSETLSGVLSGDSVTLAGTAAFGDKNVGAGKMVTATGLSLTGAAAGDYVLTDPTETTIASITPRTVTASITANSKVYDGTTAATLNSQSLVNAVAGDALALQIGNAPRFNSKDVGSASAVSVSGLSLSGADAGNYRLAATTASAPASITPLTVTGSVSVANKVYDGTTAGTIATRSLSGVLAGDAVTLAGGAATFADAKVASNKAVTVSGLTLAGAQAGDYTLSDPTEKTTASITPMAITGTVFNDTNLNGAPDSSDAGLAGRVVYLEIPGRGTKGAKSTKTAANGSFTFSNVAAGSYVVALATKAGWRATTETADSISLSPGGQANGVDFGQSNASSIQGRVFLDSSGTGKVTAADSAQANVADLAGITLTLTGTGHSAGTALTATTAADGSFAFTVVAAGTYRLTVTPPAGLTLSPRSAKAYALNLTAAKTVTSCNFGEEPITVLASLRVSQAGHRRAA